MNKIYRVFLSWLSYNILLILILTIMLRNYLTIAFRNFWKYKGFTSINVIGLTLGIACSILILLWVQDELSINRFHQEGEQIHKVMFNMNYPDGTVSTWMWAPYPLVEVLENEYPEVDHAAMVSWNNDLLFTLDDTHIMESGYYASPGFFKIFSFPLLQGDKDKVLEDIQAVAISESLATKLFGENWAQQTIVGKSVRLNIEKDDNFIITGVFADPPKNSTLQFDFVLPMKMKLKIHPWDENWGNYNNRLFVKLYQNTNLQAFNEKFSDVIARYREDYEEKDNEKEVAFLYPFEEFHLKSKFENGVNTGGRIEYVRIFSVVAILVLILACINFMNLATARSARRAKEVGIRKAVGASKASLVMQFIGEAFLITAFALIIALVLTELLLPVFNNLTQKELSIDFTEPAYWGVAFGLVIVTSLVAGSYPAFFISSFNTVKVLKGNRTTHFNAAVFRKGLVVFQFTLSIIMITGALIVHTQLRYIMERNIGLDRENVFVYYLKEDAPQHYETIKNELVGNPNISGVTAANNNPIAISSTTSSVEWEGKQEGQSIEFNHIWVDFDFVETMGMELADGRDFSKAMGNDSANVLFNEAAIKAMGLEDPIGKKFKLWDDYKDGEIIGVIKDFHSGDVFSSVAPLMVILSDEHHALYVRSALGKVQESLAAVEKIHQTYSPSYPFEYSFLDEQFESMYRSEVMMGDLSNYFTFLAIFISCLGLLGLASFTAEQRVKEIGIRKVLGASVIHIVALLSKGYVQLIIISFVIAIPVANYFITEWLGSFAYKTEISWWLYAVPGVVILLIAILTISRQTFKAAVKNPVESLKYE